MDILKTALFLVTEPVKDQLSVLLERECFQDSIRTIITSRPSEFYHLLFGSGLRLDALVLEYDANLEIDKVKKSLSAQKVDVKMLYITNDGCNPKGHYSPDELNLHRLMKDIRELEPSIENSIEKTRSNTTKVSNTDLVQLQRGYKSILNGAGEGIVGLNEKGVITFANPMAEQLLDVPISKLIGMPFIEFTQDSPLQLGSSNQSFVENRPSLSRVGRGVIRRSNGSAIVVEYTHSHIGLDDGDNVSVMVIEDITERVKFESALASMATYDRLTGLYNRVFYELALKKEMDCKRGNPGQLCQCLIDLDGFKQINDQHGHVVGDAVLVEIAQRLKECVRREDMTARLGGDEFVVLFKNANSEAVNRIANHIVQVINAPIVIDQIQVQLSCSIGIYFMEDFEESIQEVLKKSDQAMYSVKNRGKNGIAVYQRKNNVSNSLNR